MDLVLALDAGTTGVRTVAFDGQGKLLTSSYRELTQYFPEPGQVEHDPNEIVESCLATLGEVARQVLADGHRVVALGITNQRETTVGFDRATGATRHRALVWQDRRTAARCSELEAAGAGARVRELTGLVLDPYFSGTKMDWLVQASALEGFSEPAFATIDTWLLWHLTGGPAGGVFATEASNASRTMLLELSTRSWSRELGELLRVDPALLAEVRPSVGSFGTINAPAVPELAGVPITAILGDQQAALFGQACFHPGMVKATYGTGSFVLAHAGSQVPAPTDGLVSTIAWDLGDFGAAAYAYEGSAFVAGAAIQWMRDELGLLASSAELDALADTVSDSGGLSFVPAFTGLGSPFWRPEARGVLLGLSRGSTKAHLARAMLEALAFQVRAITDTFAAAGLELRELRADGGVTASKRLLELQATASRLPVRRAASVEATARGAATAAALGVGLVSSLEQLEEFWTAERTVEPSEPFFLDLAYEAWRRAASRA